MNISTNPVRLVLADPSLVDARGHHFSLTLQLAKGAYELGIETIWLTHKDCELNNVGHGIEIMPVFSMTMYDRYKPELKNKLPDHKEQILFKELQQAFATLNLNQNEHVFFHTAFGDLYRTLPLFIKVAGAERMPYLHLCTPYEPEIMPGRDPGDAVIDILHSLKSYKAIDKKIFFWAETPQLASDYSLRFGFNVRALQLPPPAIPAKLNDGATTGAFIALYLGAAREEKGFLHLPEIIEKLYKRHGKSGEIKFVIQCTPQIIGRLPVIQKAIDKMANYPDTYVSLVQDVLSEDEYHDLLAQSDVLLLLYDRKNYRIRGSGIAVEAVSSNKCILTFRDTFCASLISHRGGEAVESVVESIEKLALMIDNKNEYRRRAQEQGRQYREVNSVGNYVKRIMNQPTMNRSPEFFPSQLLGKIIKPLLKI